MSLSSLVDGLAVVEDLCGLRTPPTAARGSRVQACMPPHVAVPKPGPCPGKRGLPSPVKKPRAQAIGSGKKPAAAPGAGKKQAAPPVGQDASPVPPGAGKTVAARELFAPTGQREFTPVTDAGKLATVKGAFEVSHAGMSSQVTVVKANADRVTIAGVVKGPDGAEIGEFEAEVRLDRRGGIFTDLGLLLIEPEFQGQGFARQFTNQWLAWGRESGMDRATLFANIEVGAVAWARAGWDWGSEFDARALQARLRTMAGGKDKKAAGLARDMLDRFDASAFGTPGYPTPLELSEMGRRKGQGKGDTWPGLALFASHPDPEHEDHLGWNAEVRFPKTAATVAAATRADRHARDEMMAALVAAHDQWVGANLDGTPFQARTDSKDFNLYYVDIDASGSAQDDLAAAVAEVLEQGRAGPTVPTTVPTRAA